MNRLLTLTCCLLMGVAPYFAGQLSAQSPLFVSRDFRGAVARGTRTMDGYPGPRYWQNRANYTLEARVDPDLGQVRGNGTITYFNFSPDTLGRLNLKLIQNVHMPQARRAAPYDPAYTTGGVVIERVFVDGAPLAWDNAAVAVSADPTNAWLPLPTPLPPGGRVRIDLDWFYMLQRSADDHREGMVDSTAFFCAYWFPRVAVYDDVRGWDRVPHNGQTEFYNDFGDFDVTVRVPAGFVVWATGELHNAAAVLAEPFLGRLRRSYRSDSTVHVVTAADLRRGPVTVAADTLTWHFRAANVTDFAFGGSDHFLWDAASVVVDPDSGRRASVQTAYKETSADYPYVLDIARRSLAYFSTVLPGIPYPYPVMTVFNGYGQMEYPMMCNDVEQASLDDTHTLTTHEIAHTYFPFLTGTDESTYAWMDEGWASFLEYHACTEAFRLDDPGRTFPAYYLGRYRHQTSSAMEVPLLTPSHQLLAPTYGINAYGKPAAAYVTLMHLLGREAFRGALQGYVERWRGRHPQPYDFFYSLANLSGLDLDWFWQRWFAEFNTMDLALTAARREGGAVYVTVANPGGRPLPVTLETLAADGARQRFSFSPALWRDRASVELALAVTGIVREVRLVWPDLVDTNSDNDWVGVRSEGN